MGTHNGDGDSESVELECIYSQLYHKYIYIYIISLIGHLYTTESSHTPFFSLVNKPTWNQWRDFVAGGYRSVDVT